jgi:hypothetical protein
VALGRRLERPLAAHPLERHEQLGPLGEGEERLAALELRAARAARERLHADHVPRREVEHRLEDRPDVRARDRVLEQLAAADLLAHGLARDLVPRLLDAAIDERRSIRYFGSLRMRAAPTNDRNRADTSARSAR